VLTTLEATSRTFYLPIVRMPAGLQEAVASAYLCMRAIDEVEDHPDLDPGAKARLLAEVSEVLQAQSTTAAFDHVAFGRAFAPYAAVLPPVTMRLATWAHHAPPSIAPRIWADTASMADRMAAWALCGWRVRTEADLDRYTFSVAGAVGLLLSEIWAWYDGTNCDRADALGYGRGLQAVNILRNREDDLHRDVDFFPDGWEAADMSAYARRQLAMGETYIRALPPGPVLDACRIPHALAIGTLDAMDRGVPKLSRAAVMEILRQLAPG